MFYSIKNNVDVVNSKTICKLTSISATIRHDDWYSVDSEVFFYPDLARSAEKVSGSVKEGHGMVSEHREDMPKHPDFANSAFGNPSDA